MGKVHLKIFVMAIIPLAYCLTAGSLSAPTVCIASDSCLVGRRMPGYRIDSFEAFMGIPFALPPVGELRFSNPRPFPSWHGTLNATQPKEDCLQQTILMPQAQPTGDEDCLYLNVYRPENSQINSRKLPVMVYIHGGGWLSGSANPAIVGPEYFMDTQEVILVVITYRLGVFGFLATNDSVVPGNFGMKDQRMALKWVQENIAAFGGDPQQVTIFGQSAGGASTHLQMLSKNSQGLFQAVISQSGTATLQLAFAEDPLTVARATAEYCNITNAKALSSTELVKALRAMDAKALLAAANHMKYWDTHPLILYRIVAEHSDPSEAFLTENPLKTMASGNYKPVRFMTGVVPGEGGIRLPIWESVKLRSSFNNDFDNLLEKFIEFPEHFTRDQVQSAMEKIINEYFEGQHKLTKQGIIDLVGDRIILHSFYRDTKTFANGIDTSKYPLELYLFNYTGPYSYASIFTGGLPNLDYGVVHCDDLIYLFRSPALFPDFEKNSTPARVSQALVKHFVNFAINGNSTNPKCTKENYPQKSMDSICDYTSFQNGPMDSFTVTADNKFNLRRMRMWDEILQY